MKVMPRITLTIIYNLRKIKRPNCRSIFPQVVFPSLIKYIQTGVMPVYGKLLS